MGTRKKVITVVNDVEEFQRQINVYDGFATQFSTCCNTTDVIYSAIIFIKEE